MVETLLLDGITCLLPTLDKGSGGGDGKDDSSSSFKMLEKKKSESVNSGKLFGWSMKKKRLKNSENLSCYECMNWFVCHMQMAIST